jgi:hypothetical protein
MPVPFFSLFAHTSFLGCVFSFSIYNIVRQGSATEKKLNAVCNQIEIVLYLFKNASGALRQVWF